MSIASEFMPVFPAGDISPRVTENTRVQHGLLSPMRDGTLLSMDLIRPDINGPLPVVLVRTPYDKMSTRGNPALNDLARRGYIVALQDTRGRFNSDGVFFPYKDDRQDGYDTVEWVAAQEWCDGNIGMAGGSYVGQTQWFAAADNPPHLKCIIPVVSPPDAFFNEPICNGCLLLPMGEWMVWMGRRSYQTPSNDPTLRGWRDYYDGFPASGLAERAGSPMPWWDEMMRHPNLDDLWRACSYQDAWPNISVPALNISGWWDMNFPGTPMNFMGMRRHGKTQAIRDAQKMIVGPWPHQGNRTRTLNGVDFGPTALTNLNDYMVRFYDRYLKGI
jgi:putative CocE/NonD family hydrolase